MIVFHILAIKLLRLYYNVLATSFQSNYVRTYIRTHIQIYALPYANDVTRYHLSLDDDDDFVNCFFTIEASREYDTGSRACGVSFDVHVVQ